MSESCWSTCPLVGHCLGSTSARCPLLEWTSCFLGDSFCSMAWPHHHGGSPSSCEGFSSVPGGERGALLFLDSRETGRFRAVIVTGISLWKFLPYQVLVMSPKRMPMRNSVAWKMEFATEKYKALLRVQVDSS